MAEVNCRKASKRKTSDIRDDMTGIAMEDNGYD